MILAGLSWVSYYVLLRKFIAFCLIYGSSIRLQAHFGYQRYRGLSGGPYLTKRKGNLFCPSGKIPNESTLGFFYHLHVALRQSYELALRRLPRYGIM